jgi:hypothetical protein
VRSVLLLLMSVLMLVLRCAGLLVKGANGEPQPYWLVRNSFSKTWGAQGYFKIAKGKDTCGIEGNAVIPIAA